MGQSAGREEPGRPLNASRAQVLVRGLTRRCPVCGHGHLFPRWFRMLDRCPGCGFRFEREPGHWIGALGMNTVASFGLLLVTIVVGVVASAPDIAVVPVVGASAGVAVGAPLLLFPFSRTAWSAIDLLMRPLEEGELPDRPPPSGQ